jgi:superfamily I DNA/RNA helicase
VVVVGRVEGLIPFVDRDRPAAEQERLHSEQRRLFYVAITRTRNILVLSSPVLIPLNWAHQMGLRIGPRDALAVHAVASTFLGELGPSRPHSIQGDELVRQLRATEPD